MNVRAPPSSVPEAHIAWSADGNWVLDELGNWRPTRNKFKDGGYFEAYHAHIEKTEPKEDWNDRNLLYGL